MHRFLISCLCFLLYSGVAAQDFVGRCTDQVFKSQFDLTEQRYVKWVPAQAREKYDVLLVFHGHGSDRWQFVRDARDECRATRDFAQKHQMIFVSPDYRAKTSWMGPAAEADTLQIIEEVKSRHPVNRIYLAGASMGGTAVLTLAVLHPEKIDGVCSMNGMANLLEYVQFQEAIKESFGGDKITAFDQYKKRSAEYWPEKIKMPLSITAGGKDELVPPQSVVRLAAILKKLQRPVFINYRENGGHFTTHADALEALEWMRYQVVSQPNEAR